MPEVVVRELVQEMVRRMTSRSVLKFSTLDSFFNQTNIELERIFGPQFKPLPYNGDKESIVPFYRAALAQARRFRARCQMIGDPIKVDETPPEELEKPL